MRYALAIKHMLSSEETVALTITILGVGGCGCAAAERIYRHHLNSVHTVAIDTTRTTLDHLEVEHLLIGATVTHGNGAGGNPDLGREAARSSMDDIDALFNSARQVYLLAGVGGGTGSGATPVIAQIAKERQLPVISIVTEPFDFEGAQRRVYGDDALAWLRRYSDDMYVVDNDRILTYAGIGGALSRSFELRADALTWVALSRMI
jgi:cell division protein FtsZ